MQHSRSKVDAALNSVNPGSRRATRVGEKRQRLAAAEGAAAPTALIIEPQPANRARIRRRLEREGIAVAEAEDGLTGWNVVRRRQPDLILSSLQSRGLGGIDLLKRVRATSDLPIILYTATPDVAAAVEATKLGAQDVLLVPSDLEKLIERARTLVTQNAARALSGLEERIIGKSSHMQRVRERVLALSSLRVPVLVYGEPGTGRDHIVRTLHAMSGDCSDDLLVVRDSASPSARGHLENGIFYLDDVHCLTRAAQAYWLDKLAASQRGKGPLRIYASTSENLHAISRSEDFDRTLATWISRFTIELPPLRERIEDLAELSRSLVARAAREMGRGAVRLTPPAIAALRCCTWSHNVRELQVAIEKLVAFAQKGRITREDVRSVLSEASTSVASLRRKAEQEQRQELVSLLEKSGGNLAEAARRINMSRGAVIYRAKKFGLLPNRSRRG
jgi:DNA-binding NtrC family response regulator